MPLTLPTGGIQSIEWNARSSVAISESPFSLTQQVQVFPGQARTVTVRLAPRTVAEAKEWIAFFLETNGPENTFWLSDTIGQNPTLTRGTPLVNGAGQTGSTLLTDGWSVSTTVLDAGEWLSLDGRLHQVTEDAKSDASGVSVLSLWPSVRNAPADNDPIEADSPAGLFRLAEIPSWGWDINRMMAGVAFTAAEAIGIDRLDPESAFALYLPETANSATVLMDVGGSTNEVIHTSPAYKKGGFGPDNHPYWLGVTAYPGFAAARENPSVLSSADGETWVEPTGMTNPIQATPAGSDYNADIHLLFIGSTLHCFWTEVNDAASEGEYLWRHASSTDGITWSVTGSAIKTGTYNGVSGDALSPSVVQLADGTYGAWAVDASAGAAGSYTLDYYTSSSLTSWTNTHTAVTLNGLPSTHRIWHAWVVREEGRFFGVFAVQPKTDYAGTATGAGSDVELYIGKTGDPLIWDIYFMCQPNRDLLEDHWANASLYRSGFWFDDRLGKVAVSAYRDDGSDNNPRFAIVTPSKVQPRAPDWDWIVHSDPTSDYYDMDVDGSDNITAIRAWDNGTATANDGTLGAGTLTLSTDGIEVAGKGIYWATTAASQITCAVIYKLNEASPPAGNDFLIRCNAMGLWQYQRATSLVAWTDLATDAYGSLHLNFQRYIQSEWRLAIISNDGTYESMICGTKGHNGRFSRTTSALKTFPTLNNTIRAIGNSQDASMPDDMTVRAMWVLDSGSSEQVMHEIYHSLQSEIPD